MSAEQLKAKEKIFRIFVIEDDIWYGEFLVHHLKMNPDYEVTRFEAAREALAQLHLQPDVITLDYSLPDLSGDEALKRIKIDSPNTSVVMISGQENVATAIELLKKGVYDYLVKDDDTRERLWNTVNNIRKNVELRKENDFLRDEMSKKYDVSNLIIGTSEPMKKVFNLISKASKTAITVSLSGETGTGKELVAKSIHLNSSRSRKPFVTVNVSAIPRDLIESELFGHEKGSFTGAITRRIGKFEEAHQGTLFLDEIAELDFSLQAKLLRVLQEKEITRIGSNEVIPIDARIIVATHKNLVKETKRGNFREDLYYRLLGLPITLPPLRDRSTDVLLLSRYFIDKFCLENNLPVKVCTPEAKDKLISYTFPGNVRELKSIMELAAVMTDNDLVDAEDISFNAAQNNIELLDQDLTLEEYEYQIIRHYLKKYKNNVLEVAHKLNIGKSTIYRLLKEKKL